MLEPPVISSTALDQLAAWEALARDWATLDMLDVDTGIWVVRCASCFTGIYRKNDGTGTDYQYSPEQTLALTVAHLRQAHLELDPDRG